MRRLSTPPSVASTACSTNGSPPSSSRPARPGAASLAWTAWPRAAAGSRSSPVGVRHRQGDRGRPRRARAATSASPGTATRTARRRRRTRSAPRAGAPRCGPSTSPGCPARPTSWTARRRARRAGRLRQQRRHRAPTPGAGPRLRAVAHVLATDLDGAFLCLQRAARRMVAAGRGGRIVEHHQRARAPARGSGRPPTARPRAASGCSPGSRPWSWPSTASPSTPSRPARSPPR